MPEFSFKVHQIQFRIGLCRCPSLCWGSLWDPSYPLAIFWGRWREKGWNEKERGEGWERRRGGKERGVERGMESRGETGRKTFFGPCSFFLHVPWLAHGSSWPWERRRIRRIVNINDSHFKWYICESYDYIINSLASAASVILTVWGLVVDMSLDSYTEDCVADWRFVQQVVGVREGSRLGAG